VRGFLWMLLRIGQLEGFLNRFITTTLTKVLGVQSFISMLLYWFVMVGVGSLKKFSLFTLIGSLIVSALTAVVVVLVGGFNDLSAKVMITLLSVAVHSLASLLFIRENEKERALGNLHFFSNVLFILIILSFFTSVFKTWNFLSSDLVSNLYQSFFVIGFAALHGDVLGKALQKKEYIDIAIYVNYLFMAVVVVMLELVIFLGSNYFGELFLRILAAAAILDGTLTLLALIFYRWYVHTYPKIENPLQGGFPLQAPSEKKKGLSLWVWVLIIFLLIQIVLPLLIFFGVFVINSF